MKLKLVKNWTMISFHFQSLYTPSTASELSFHRQMSSLCTSLHRSARSDLMSQLDQRAEREHHRMEARMRIAQDRETEEKKEEDQKKFEV